MSISYNSEKKKSKSAYFFTALLIIYPILSLYLVLGSPVALSDLLLMLFVIKAVFENIQNVKVSFSENYLPYFVYILVHLIFSIFITDLNLFDLVGTTLRYSLYLFTVSFIIKKYYDVEFAIHIYRWSCVICVFWALTQVVLYSTVGFYLPGYIENPIFPVNAIQIKQFENSMFQSWFNNLRPRSFFAEPAHYSEYLLGGLAITLFDTDNNQSQKRKDIIIILIILLGLLISASSTGILTGSVLLVIYAIIRIRSKINKTTLLLFVMVLPLVLLSIFKSNSFNSFLKRLNYSFEGRFNGYSSVELQKKDPVTFLFGNGMINTSDRYLAGYNRLFVYFGLFGCLIFGICTFSIFLKIKKTSWRKMVFLTFLILNTGTELLFQPMIVVFIPLFILDEKERLSNKPARPYV